MKIPRHPVIVALFATVALSCSLNPVNHRPQLVLTSKKTERALGEQQAAKIEATIGVVKDNALADYVETIGERLIAQAPTEGFDFHFHVVNMKEPNAFALPGGHIYVSRGILALANSEDELAGVIGHEIAHVIGRHTGARITLGAPLKIITGIGSAVTGRISSTVGNLIGAVGGITEGLLLSPYDRQQERRADRYGLELAAAAGWNPAALAEILHRLELEEEMTGHTSRGFGFFDSHPRTPERVHNTTVLASELKQADRAPIAATQRAFLDKLDGLTVGDDPAAGVFAEELFIQPDMGFAIQFPKGWKTANGDTQVIAASPDEQALAVLQIAGKGSDPSAVARAVAKHLGIDSDTLTHDVNINGLSAVRSRRIRGTSGRQEVALEATWIAYDGNVYQIISATTPDKADTFHDDALRTAHSFRAATSADLARVKITRVRIREARGGETVAAFVDRTGSAWDTEAVAIANSVEKDAIIHDGTPVKVAIVEAYQPH